MREPFARPTSEPPKSEETRREPRAFGPETLEDTPHAFEPSVEILTETESADLPELAPRPASRRMGWIGRTVFGAGGIIVSFALWLWADQLVRDLFARYEWLGWAALAAVGLFVLAVLAFALREILALRRLRQLDHLRDQARDVLVTDDPGEGKAVLAELDGLYHARADLARARQTVAETRGDLFDGTAFVNLAEHQLMAPLDGRARALTAASARRVAVVTAISPRALVDVGFVVYESFRLAGAIARLYGARPGFFGAVGLTRAVLSHLAVTGGVAIGDSLVQQLVGQGLAARLSARLGEGLVNGLMTVRVGIAAMEVTRPLPFAVLSRPAVADFLPELAKVASGKTDETG